MDALLYAGECPRCGAPFPLVRHTDGTTRCAVYGHHGLAAAAAEPAAPPVVQQLPLELPFGQPIRRRNPTAPAAALVVDVLAATGRPGPPPGNVVRLHGRARGITQGKRYG
jgi:hypothetical protein